jgi:septum formation protein
MGHHRRSLVLGVGAEKNGGRIMGGATTKQTLILASASPRRLELLRRVGIEPDTVEAADIDEGPLDGEGARALVLRLARAKAEAVAAKHPAAFVVAGDTIVAVGRRMLPKPAFEAEARRCLELLSGRRHRVHGGVAVIAPGGASALRHVETTVSFKRLGEDEIAGYLDCREWRGKAGGYAIQGRAGLFVRRINGSYSNIVGLPLFETGQLLRGLGFGGLS